MPGNVANANTEVTAYLSGGWYTIRNQAKVLSKILPGDSGGPLYSGNTALGIASLRQGDIAWGYFTRIRSAEAVLGVNVVQQ
jgi:hypothetical protein